MIELLLNNGAKINKKMRSSERTALHMAAFTGYIPLIILLIEMGANLRVQDIRGDTPYDLAIRYFHYEAAQLLDIDGSSTL